MQIDYFLLPKIKVKPLAQTCKKLRSGFVVSILLRYKDFFNQWKLYIISAVVLIMLLIGFIFWRQDEHTARDFENKDTALKQNTSENSSLSKLEDVQVKDGDNSKNKGPVYIDVKVLLNILMFTK